MTIKWKESKPTTEKCQVRGQRNGGVDTHAVSGNLQQQNRFNRLKD